jgi:hypothetical protein
MGESIRALPFIQFIGGNMGQAKRRQKDIEALKKNDPKPGEPLRFEVTEKDVDDAVLVDTAFPPTLQLKPSQVGGPVLMALLRTTTKGFPLVGHETIAFVEGPDAEVLRSVYQRFIEGKSTAEQFSAVAMPLLITAWAEHEADDAADTQEAIEDHIEDSKDKEPN